MTKHRILSFFALAAALPLAVNAQDAPDPVAEALAEAMLPISQDGDGTLSGEGFDRLVEDGRDAQFVLVGEQHGAREIALAEASLHRALAPEGFDYMVVELGPWSTRFAEALIREGDGALAAHIRSPGMQFTLPFIFFEEELALAEQGVALSPAQDHALWGVDQEFLGAGPILLQALQAEASSDAERAAVDAFATNVAANPMHLGLANDADIDALRTAFANGSEEAQAIIEAVTITNRIYGPFMRGTGPIYPANLERENYMKRNFVEHFNAAEERDGEAPRAFFKFGGYHMERGLSGTDVPAFGNFVIEWGRARGFDAFNIMVDCNGGEAYGIQQGGGVPCESYYLEEGSPMSVALGDQEAALFDLRSLRPGLRRMRDIDPRLRDLILSYDYYLVISDVTPQTPGADLTLPDM